MNSFEIDDKLYKKVYFEIPHELDYNLMADLLFLLTTKNEFKYLIFVTDIYNSEFDIQQIKIKESNAVLNALLKIFKRQYIKKAKASIFTDAGTEFKSAFAKYLYDNNINHKVASTARHTQQASVESLNRVLSKIIMIYLAEKSR